MKGSLRIMHFGFLISVIVAVLIIGKSLEISAHAQDVVCPCDFEAVPMTTGCWSPPNLTGATYLEEIIDEGGQQVLQVCSAFNDSRSQARTAGVIKYPEPGTGVCVISAPPGPCDPDGNVGKVKIPLNSTEELRACQCELLAYVTALNEGGIMVSGGPPYECFDVDCRQMVLTPIPTLNEWGMIATAGVLGLVGFMVLRRRKATA